MTVSRYVRSLNCTFIMRYVAFCIIIIIIITNGFLMSDTKTDDLKRYMWVYNVRKLNRTRMSDAFLADTI